MDWWGGKETVKEAMVLVNGNKGSILGMAVTMRDAADRLGVHVGAGTTGCTFLSTLNTDATNTQSRQNMVIAHLVSEGRQMEGRLFTCPIMKDMKDKEYLSKYQEAFQSLEKTETLFFTTLTLAHS